jgi:hypothetical protein
VDNANPTPAPAPAPFNAWAKKLQVEAQRDPINLIEPKPKSLWDRPTETVNAKDEGHDVDEGLVEEFEGDESGAGVIRAF